MISSFQQGRPVKLFYKTFNIHKVPIFYWLSIKYLSKPTSEMSMFKNRLEKNYRKLKVWAERSGFEAFRLYDRDIPEFPFIVDTYKNIFVVYDRSEWIDQNKNHLPLVLAAIKEIFKVHDDAIILKKREKQEGHSQYEKISESGHRFAVQEGSWKFWVNPYDYLDTGLFLDHRPLRQYISKQVQDKDFLNLFCYTGAFSVAAAKGGARTTSVDMSNTYIEWAKDNFKLNDVDLSSHRFIQADALEYLKDTPDQLFDVIFLDPPTFSKSKRMTGTFEVERDQLFLVESCMKRLKPGGALYFSNNKRNFKLDSEISKRFRTQDITAKTIPQDFHDKKIHQVYLVIGH